MGLSPTYRASVALTGVTAGSITFGYDERSVDLSLVPTFRASANPAIVNISDFVAAQVVASGGADMPFTHNQTTESSIWTVVHNLGHFADITIVDGAGEQVIGKIVHDSVNQATITFSQPITGTARAD